MRLRSSPPPPTPASFFSLVSFHPRASTLPFRLPSPLPPLSSRPLPPRRRHRLRRPPLNQTKYPIICSKSISRVRPAFAFVQARPYDEHQPLCTSWTSRPMGPCLLVLIPRLRRSFSRSSSPASLLLTFTLTAPICGKLQTVDSFLGSYQIFDNRVQQ